LRVNGYYINQKLLLDWWWMSAAYDHRRSKRMLWTTDNYYRSVVVAHKIRGIQKVHVYKALDIAISHSPVKHSAL
jgi:hypothetical protein